MKIADKVTEIKSIPGTTVWVAQTGLSEGVIIKGSIPGGRIDAPERGRELAGLTAELLDEGTRRHKREVLRDLLLGLGATITFRTRAKRIEFSVTCITSTFEKVVELIAEMLYEPAFDAAALTVVKARLLGQLSERRLDSRVQVSEALTRALYPKASPLHIGDYKSQLAALKGVSRDAVRTHHQRMLSGKFHLVVAGDVKPVLVERVLKKYFGKHAAKSWERTEQTDVKPLQLKAGPEKFSVISIPDKASVDTLWGFVPRIQKSHPDFAAYNVAIQILGGGFMSRLMQEIREKRGLTYGIYTRLVGFEGGLLGHGYVWGTFAPAVFKQATQEVEKVLSAFTPQSITEREVEAKKGRLMGMHKISCSSTDEICSVLLTILDDARPHTYVDTFLEETAAVSLAQVKEVIAKYFHPESFVRLAAGSITEKGTPLT